MKWVRGMPVTCNKNRVMASGSVSSRVSRTMR